MRSPIESECSRTLGFLAVLPPRSTAGQLTLDFSIQTPFLLKTNYLQHIPARIEVSAIANTNQAVTKNAKSVCHVYVRHSLTQFLIPRRFVVVKPTTLYPFRGW